MRRRHLACMLAALTALAVFAARPSAAVEAGLQALKTAAARPCAALTTEAVRRAAGDRQCVVRTFTLDTGTTTLALQYQTFPGEGAADNRRLLNDGCSGYGMLLPNASWYTGGFLDAALTLAGGRRACGDREARVAVLARDGRRAGYDLVYDWPDATVVVRTMAIAGRDELFVAIYGRARAPGTAGTLSTAFQGYPIGFTGPFDRCVHAGSLEFRNAGAVGQPTASVDLARSSWLLLTDHLLNAKGDHSGQLGIVFDRNGLAKVDARHGNNYSIGIGCTSAPGQGAQRFIVCNFDAMSVKAAEEALAGLAAHTQTLLAQAFDGLPDPFAELPAPEPFDALPLLNPPAPPDPAGPAPTGPVRALVGCWESRYGYDALLDVRRHLDRALGPENVDIRTGCPVVDWPQSVEALRAYQLVVITDLPAKAFQPAWLEALKAYVEGGGRLVMISTLTGWLHDPATPWAASPLGSLLPLGSPAGDTDYRRVVYDPRTPLFAGFPPDLPLTTRSALCAPVPGAASLAGLQLLEADAAKGAAGPVSFIAEKKTGAGSVLLIPGCYVQNATVHRHDRLADDFFQSPFAPLFWDNLVAYLTGTPVTHPAPAPVRPPVPATRAVLDILTDNYGDIFRPGGRLTVTPRLTGEVAYPYEARAFIERDGQPEIAAGACTLADAQTPVSLALPSLDAGVYRLRLELARAGARVATAAERFAVALPLIASDEFNFEVITLPNNLGETDCARIARDLTSIGFTRVSSIGGTTVGSYDGFNNREALFYSRMQEAGLRVRPVWYPVLFELLTGTGRSVGPAAPAPAPDPAFPDKAYLPHTVSWLRLFGDTAFGRMPLTEGMVASDETTGVSVAMTDRLAKGYQARVGAAPPKDAADPRFYQALRYRLDAASHFIWLARSTAAAYHPAWVVDSIISPNSFAGHASTLTDLFGTISSLGTASPDEYWYGEKQLYPKSLASMAVTWSASGFGRLSRPGFTGGQLGNNYYREFPEQVFAALAGGAREFKVFAFDCASFERHGRQDPRFAAIARRTTREAGRIGRTLNHYARARARVALLFPQTAYIITAMGKKYNPDYLAMTGDSEEYLDLGFAFQAEFDLLRRLFGHVDVLFDEQIARGELRNYDLVVAGYCRQVEERTLRALRRYLEGGGTLLVSSDSARYNELQQPTGTLCDILPATVGAGVKVATDYSGTGLRRPAEWSTGNALAPKAGAEVLFPFPDGAAACVRGPVGRGEAIVLGLPLAALRAGSGAARRDLLAALLTRRVALVSKPDDGEFSAVTFTQERDGGRIFLVANHRKVDARTRVTAAADDDDARATLADIVTGEKIPFTVQDGLLSFDVAVPDRWGRALALLREAPAAIEVSVSDPTAAPGKVLVILVRLLGKDGQPVQATLPVNLLVTDPDGNERDDLSGVRIVEGGVYAFSLPWPANARKGLWTVTASDQISETVDRATWQAP